MCEKYDSGVLHPSEVLEMFRKLDVVDKEKFLEMLSNENGVSSVMVPTGEVVEWLDENIHPYHLIECDNEECDCWMKDNMVESFRKAFGG